MNLERLFISIKFFSFFLLCSKICITENVHLLTGDKSEVLSESLDNKIVFLASFSTCLLMVYRNVINFSTLVLYPAPLMRVFISSKIFFFFKLVLQSLIYRITLTTVRDNFTSSFPIFMYFI